MANGLGDKRHTTTSTRKLRSAVLQLHSHNRQLASFASSIQRAADTVCRMAEQRMGKKPRWSLRLERPDRDAWRIAYDLLKPFLNEEGKPDEHKVQSGEAGRQVSDH